MKTKTEAARNIETTTTSPAPGDHAARVARIKGALLVEAVVDQTVAKAGLREACGACTDQEFGLALHDAREELRRDLHLEFVPVRGQPGFLCRATEKQKLDRALTFRRTSVRKLKRAGAVLEAADPEGLTPDDRARLQMAQDKTAMMVVHAGHLLRRRVPDLSINDATPAFPARPPRKVG